jgi:hypothetical protein
MKNLARHSELESSATALGSEDCTEVHPLMEMVDRTLSHEWGFHVLTSICI